jgi:bifunctional UDP-N-acetylglucosamine pyrophosphorylase/glucosamine-1-phosphate N-acetyltransferase
VGLARLEAGTTLILCADTPLVEASELEELVAHYRQVGGRLALLTALVDDPSGYGRVLRGETGEVLEIREDRDLANSAERSIREVNSGIYVADVVALKALIAEIRPVNAQGEYYLTDAVRLAARSGTVAGVRGRAEVLVGVNDRHQLAEAEVLLFRAIARRHGKNGALVRGDARVDDTVIVEADATIEAGVSVRGCSSVGAGAVVDTGSVISNSSIGPKAVVKPYSVVTDSRVGEGAQIGPFAHLRPGSEIEQDAHIGNFVETKKTLVRRGAKANHLAYIGDADVGEGANIGAGTIFCNYDGFQKHKTTIGRGAFIGSDSQLVAPVTIGEGAYVATGTTVTMDVPPDALAIARVRQENKPNYASKLKRRLAAAAGKPLPPLPGDEGAGDRGT